MGKALLVNDLGTSVQRPELADPSVDHVRTVTRGSKAWLWLTDRIAEGRLTGSGRA
ncbi:hypothetical protein [Paraburkholderia phenoliruptrix]|uniref:hypothetical protein n=1 Tax=Paraburkholderia phenoliruptrix TaxID=252970 RepID=UPI0015832A87|nr:hypothetical protein [Paraburkholderia phenoliruptrix]